MDNPGEITEILRLCRLCLVKDQVNIPIFDEQGDIRQIFLKISSCLPVKVSREDQLPKKICDGCSNKLDLLYEFWNTSANAEKTLLSWLGQAGVKDADETISAVAQQIAKPVEIPEVKEETEPLEDGQVPSHATDSFPVPSSFDEGNTDEAEAPPPKRARRTAAVKAQINLAPESDDDEDDDMDNAEPMTKMEDESDESEGEEKDPSYSEVPGTSADDQAGPSGVGKDGVEAPKSVFFRSRTKLSRHLENVVSGSSSHTISPVKGLEDKEAICDICHVQLEIPLLEKHRCFHTTVDEVPKRRSSRNAMKLVKKKRLVTNSNPECSAVMPSNQTNEDACSERRTPSEETDICIFCLKEIPFNLLAEHENAHREEEKRRTKQHRGDIPKEGTTICTMCGTSVSCKDLKKHERTHRRLGTVICTICGFSAKNIYQHMATHSEERKFSCQECGLAFKHKKNLDAHMLVHETVGRHRCPTCEKAFKTPYNLRVHLRIHQDIKPFRCHYCERTFTTKQSRNNHNKTHITSCF